MGSVANQFKYQIVMTKYECQRIISPFRKELLFRQMLQMLSWPRCQNLGDASAIKSFIRDQIRTLDVMILPHKYRGHYWFVLLSILAINVQRCGQCMLTVHHFMLSEIPPI